MQMANWQASRGKDSHLETHDNVTATLLEQMIVLYSPCLIEIFFCDVWKLLTVSDTTRSNSSVALN